MKGREIYDLRRRAKLGLYERAATLPLLQWDVTEPPPDVGLRAPPRGSDEHPGRCAPRRC